MPEAEGLGGGRVNSNKGTKMDDKTNAVVDALRNGVEMMGRATETINDLRAKLAASEAEAARLRKLFDDAGQGEHNVLALVDHYQEEAIASEANAAQMRSALMLVFADWDQLRMEGMLDQQAEPIENAMTAALATDAGKSWLSPEEAAEIRDDNQRLSDEITNKEEEAERLRKAVEQKERSLSAALAGMSSYQDEIGRLRKDLATAKAVIESIECDCGVAAIDREMDFAAAMASGEVTQERLDAAFARHFPDGGGFVSEEECARRCREVAEIWYATGKNTGKLTDLSAIIDRVAKRAP